MLGGAARCAHGHDSKDGVLHQEPPSGDAGSVQGCKDVHDARQISANKSSMKKKGFFSSMFGLSKKASRESPLQQPLQRSSHEPKEHHVRSSSTEECHFISQLSEDHSMLHARPIPMGGNSGGCGSAPPGATVAEHRRSAGKASTAAAASSQSSRPPAGTSGTSASQMNIFQAGQPQDSQLQPSAAHMPQGLSSLSSESNKAVAPYPESRAQSQKPKGQTNPGSEQLQQMAQAITGRRTLARKHSMGSKQLQSTKSNATHSPGAHPSTLSNRDVAAFARQFSAQISGRSGAPAASPLGSPRSHGPQVPSTYTHSQSGRIQTSSSTPNSGCHSRDSAHTQPPAEPRSHPHAAAHSPNSVLNTRSSSSMRAKGCSCDGTSSTSAQLGAGPYPPPVSARARLGRSVSVQGGRAHSQAALASANTTQVLSAASTALLVASLAPHPPVATLGSCANPLAGKPPHEEDAPPAPPPSSNFLPLLKVPPIHSVLDTQLAARDKEIAALFDRSHPEWDATAENPTPSCAVSAEHSIVARSSLVSEKTSDSLIHTLGRPRRNGCTTSADQVIVGLLDVPPDMPPQVAQAVGAIAALHDPALGNSA